MNQHYHAQFYSLTPKLMLMKFYVTTNPRVSFVTGVSVWCISEVQ